MIKYRENRNDIIQSVEIDLAKVTEESRQVLKRICEKYPNIFKFEGKNKLVYKTEVLIPKVTRGDRVNLLMVLGNPAVHSVAEGMFFSYEGAEGKWREHRFWRALRDCGALRFYEDINRPTPENLEKVNGYKRRCLLDGEYESDFNFNIFLLPYFSFPTQASKKSSGADYSGVAGIRKIVGKDIFEEMKVREFERFKKIVLDNYIKHVICFQKTAAGKEIICKAEGKQVGKILGNPKYPVFRLGGYLESVTLYMAPPTRDFNKVEGKKILKGIIAELEQKIG